MGLVSGAATWDTGVLDEAAAGSPVGLTIAPSDGATAEGLGGADGGVGARAFVALPRRPAVAGGGGGGAAAGALVCGSWVAGRRLEAGAAATPSLGVAAGPVAAADG